MSHFVGSNLLCSSRGFRIVRTTRSLWLIILRPVALGAGERDNAEEFAANATRKRDRRFLARRRVLLGLVPVLIPASANLAKVFFLPARPSPLPEIGGYVKLRRSSRPARRSLPGHSNLAAFVRPNSS